MRYSIAKRTLFGAAEALLGRRNLVRLSRALLDHARLDVPNVMGQNGEELVHEAALRRRSRGDPPLVALDVGANTGQWSRRLLALSDRLGIDVQVHALEPSAFTFERLVEGARAWAGGRLVAVNAAASDAPGRAVLHSVFDGAGANSLHAPWGRTARGENVEVVTVDDYCATSGIEQVGLLKSDAEGHDLNVLRGARRLLSAGAVDLVQFEYNHRWIGARSFLCDAFELLESLDYCVGKVTPRGIEWYEGWDPELETFREANYLAARDPSAVAAPTVRWWKANG